MNSKTCGLQSCMQSLNSFNFCFTVNDRCWSVSVLRNWGSSKLEDFSVNWWVSWDYCCLWLDQPDLCNEWKRTHFCGDYRTYSLWCNHFWSVFHPWVSKMVGKKQLLFLCLISFMVGFKKLKSYFIVSTGKDRKSCRFWKCTAETSWQRCRYISRSRRNPGSYLLLNCIFYRLHMLANWKDHDCNKHQ